MTAEPPVLPARLFVAAAVIAGMLLTAGCAHRRNDPAAEAMAWSDAQQLVLVTTPDWGAAHGTMRRFQRARGGAWQQSGDAAPVTIGRSGAAWGIGQHPIPRRGPIKREGDGRSPAGVFAIGGAFGYGASAATALPFEAMQASHYCVDVSQSPLYNRIVDAQVVGAAAVAGSTEPMRRDLHAGGDQRYRLGFVIEHNPEARPMAGSCIFAHLWKSPTGATSGCTAMDEPAMVDLLAWLRPEMRPLFVLLPAREYAPVQADWGFPAIEGRP